MAQRHHTLVKKVQIDDNCIEKKPSHTVTSTFRSMVMFFETNKSHKLTVTSVSHQFNIQSRRVYDFFNVLTSLHVCCNQGKGIITWEGLSNMESAIVTHYAKLEIDSLVKPMTKVFSLGSSPSLGSIAMNILGLYFYLGVGALRIHDMSILLSERGSDIKSLERRMYLILSLLEALDVVTHSKSTSEYVLTLNINIITNNGLSIKKNYCLTNNISSVELLVSRIDSAYKRSLFMNRRLEFYKNVINK